MSKQSPEELLRLTLQTVRESVKYHQGLIDEWNDPKDVCQRAAVVILGIHQLYGRMAFEVLQMLENNCKHPKKMRLMCADGTVYCTDCNADLREDEIMSVNTPTIIKENVVSRRKLVKKYAKQKMKQSKIAEKLNISLSIIEKDMLVLRN